MRKLYSFLFVASAICLSSCGADQKIVEKMADEICSAMSKYDEKDPIGSFDVLMKLNDNIQKEEYQDVTVSQLEGTMEKKCPDGFSKYKKMTEEAK